MLQVPATSVVTPLFLGVFSGLMLANAACIFLCLSVQGFNRYCIRCCVVVLWSLGGGDMSDRVGVCREYGGFDSQSTVVAV